MRTHRLTFSAAELADAGQVRVPVRSSNTQVMPGMFEGVDLSTGRSRQAGKGTESEIRARAPRMGRVVTLSSRYRPGDHVNIGGKLFRIISVQGRRVRDSVPADWFNAEAWAERHGMRQWNSNPWCWCLVLRRLV